MSWEPSTLNNGHKALIDLIVANPTATHFQLAAKLGRSPEWVQLVKNSGLFREALHMRLGEIVDPLLTATIDERLDIAVGRSVEVLMEKLAAPSNTISDDLAIQAAQALGKMKGIGGYSTRAPIAPPAPQLDRVERLADRLLALNGLPHSRAAADVIDMPSRDAT